METMHQRNFKSIHGAMRSRMGSKYLEKRKTGGEIRDTDSWGVDSTQELKNPMEEPKNSQRGLGASSLFFLRE
jgi:hypothetical protein